jgi:hypothetical protein
MLIDSIYRDANGNVMIDSSDMYPDISTINGSNPVQTCSIEEYYNWYNRYNGSVKGIVVLGNK